MTFLNATEVCYTAIKSTTMSEKTDKAVSVLKRLFSEVNLEKIDYLFFGFAVELSINHNTTSFSLKEIEAATGKIYSVVSDQYMTIIRKLISLHVLEPDFVLNRYVINDEIFIAILDEDKNYIYTIPQLSPNEIAMYVWEFLYKAQGNKTALKKSFNYIPVVESFCKNDSIENLKTLIPELKDRIILYLTAAYSFNNETINLQDVISILGTNVYDALSLRKMIKQGQILKGFIKLRGDEEVYLASNGKNFFCPEEFFKPEEAEPKKIIIKKNRSSSLFTVISPDKIKSEKLFYPSSVREEIDDLKKMLEPASYNRIQEVLKSSDFIQINTGLSIFLSGAPGCGKTSLVYQLAKSSNRQLFKLNLSQTKSSYVSESEKLVDKLFDEYEEACKTEDKTPILFINEADALLGNRFSDPSSESDQMEITMQNILLERLEAFSGILLCTSNKKLEELDDAFSRRFLIEINIPSFTKADLFYIWNQKYNFSENHSHQLADIPLSPAEMQNCMKRKVIKEAVNNKSVSFYDFLEICKKEKNNYIEKSSIGFRRLCS